MVSKRFSLPKTVASGTNLHLAETEICSASLHHDQVFSAPDCQVTTGKHLGFCMVVAYLKNLQNLIGAGLFFCWRGLVYESMSSYLHDI